jgi:hypothetical protein
VNHEYLRVDGEQPIHEGQVEGIEVASVGNHKDLERASTDAFQKGCNTFDVEGAAAGTTA